jgi:TonB family protein
MSAMRIVVLLCLTLALVCLAVQPTGLSTALAVAGESVAGKRPVEPEIPVVPFWFVEVTPQPVFIPEAEYPKAALRTHVEGLAVIEALVDVDGSVTDTRILKNSENESLDRAALAAAGKAKFSPAKARDQAGRTWVTVPYRFALKPGKGIAPDRSICVVTKEPRGQPPDVKSYNDSVLRPLRGLKFVRLKPVAPRRGAHGRLAPDSAAIRFNNAAMMAACTAYSRGQEDSLHRPAPYYLQSDWYYLVIDSGRCRVFQRNHPHYPSSRAEVCNVNTLAVKPGSLDTGYVEMPAWTSLPQYVPLKLEFDGERIRRTIQAPTFRLEVP